VDGEVKVYEEEGTVQVESRRCRSEKGGGGKSDDLYE